MVRTLQQEFGLPSKEKRTGPSRRLQEATGLPETPRIQGKSPYGLFYRDANQTSVPPFGQELCASLVYGL